MAISDDLQLLRKGQDVQVPGPNAVGALTGLDGSEPMDALENRRRSLPAHPELDPALLAFVKCHVTSFLKWDVLRALSRQAGRWAELTPLAREINQPLDEVRSVMEELGREDILEVTGPPDARRYRLPGGEPTSVVVARLFAHATRSQELRRIIVAHILRTAAV